MAAIWETCRECGCTFEFGKGGGGSFYCSEGCKRKAEAGKKAASAANSAESAANMGRMLKLIGIIFVALVGLITILCYKFPKFLKEKNKKFLYAYIIAWVVLIADTGTGR